MYVVIIWGLIIFVPVAWAQQPYDITECYSFVLSVLQESQEIRILGLDAKGIVQSNHANKVFENCTIHTVGIRMDMKGNSVAHGYFKYMDPDGDIFIMEGIMPEGEKAATMKFIYGTGKWKGIKGEGKDRLITRGKAITPGTAQICFRHTGSFELPK
jgi:hypothetical protein